MLKYQRWHDQIIDRARNRRIHDTYKEIHHVIPRSLGGGNEASNLVELTYREHFLVHWLLVKITTGRSKQKMAHALQAMTMTQYRCERIIAGWQVEVTKRAVKDKWKLYNEKRQEIKAVFKRSRAYIKNMERIEKYLKRAEAKQHERAADIV